MHGCGETGDALLDQSAGGHRGKLRFRLSDVGPEKFAMNISGRRDREGQLVRATGGDGNSSQAIAISITGRSHPSEKGLSRTSPAHIRELGLPSSKVISTQPT